MRRLQPFCLERHASLRGSAQRLYGCLLGLEKARDQRGEGGGERGGVGEVLVIVKVEEGDGRAKMAAISNEISDYAQSKHSSQVSGSSPEERARTWGLGAEQPLLRTQGIEVTA